MQVKTQLITWVICLCSFAVFSQSVTKVSPDWAAFSENDEPAALKDTTYLGKPCFKLDGKKQAVAFRKNAQYKNFRIDCDISGRVMSGIGFRAADHQNYHFLYFRPGYGGTREAIQYVPIFNGTLSWVLYNYPIYEKTADIQSMQWFHVALEVKGEVMKVFVNRSVDPQMEIPLIESDFKEGGLLFRTLFGESYFANISIMELPEPLIDWQLSEPFPRKDHLDLAPTTQSAKWTPVKADLAGVVNIARYISKPDGVMLARRTLKSDTEKDMVLYFDFIGRLKIFLNGQELFYYEKHKLDRIFSGTERIVLHLKKGDNDLTLVSEGDATIFGKGFNAMGRLQHQNWGFIAELGVKR